MPELAPIHPRCSQLPPPVPTHTAPLCTARVPAMVRRVNPLFSSLDVNRCFNQIFFFWNEGGATCVLALLAPFGSPLRSGGVSNFLLLD